MDRASVQIRLAPVAIRAPSCYRHRLRGWEVRTGEFTLRSVGVASCILASALVPLLAGCQSGDGTSWLGGGSQPPQAREGQVLESELRAFCPAVTLRDSTSVFTINEKGGKEDAQRVRFQASISEATRSCSRSGGMLTVNVAIAGRVVPGPAAAPGSVNLPIHIAAVQGQEVIYSDVQSHPVQIASTATATQFVYTNAQVTFPDPATANVQLFAGFDEAPGKPKAN
jgi:hypothetical protein